MAAEQLMPSPKVFVGDLPPTIDEAKLATVFGAYGNIKQAKLLPPNQSNKRGAIIDFEAQEEATWIVENVNGNIPQGLTEPVVVRYKETRSSYFSYGKAQSGSQPASTPYSCSKNGNGSVGGTGISVLVQGLLESGALPGGQKWSNDDATIFVYGLPQDTNDVDLYKIFSPFGAIAPQGVRVMLGDDRVSCRGYGFVNYMSKESAELSINTLNGTTMPDGKVLKVYFKQLNGDGQGKGSGKPAAK
jgi:RNA recognition motif-containing protein